MISRDAPWKLRVQFAIGIFLYISLGCFSAWVSLSTLLPALRASAAHASMVEFRPLYVTLLPFPVALLALTVMAFLPTPGTIPRRSRKKRRGVDPVNFLFGVAVCGVLLSTIAAPIGRWVMSDVMAARGYTACPPSDEERRPPMRWIRPGGRCP